jgi:hypothetical protein
MRHRVGAVGQIFVDHPRPTSAAEKWSPATKGYALEAGACSYRVEDQ